MFYDGANVTDSQFSNCTAIIAGGAAFSEQPSSLRVENPSCASLLQPPLSRSGATMSSDSPGGNGIFSSQTSFVAFCAVRAFPTATGPGLLTLDRVNVSLSSAGGGGGALEAYHSDVIITGSSMTGNTAWNGGVLSLLGAPHASRAACGVKTSLAYLTARQAAVPLSAPSGRTGSVPPVRASVFPLLSNG